MGKLWTILEVKELVEPWDEYYDVDEDIWTKIPDRFIGRPVIHGDVIRREVRDVSPTVRSLIAHIDQARGKKALPKDWFDRADQYICEIKRRWGERSIGEIREDGRVRPTVGKKEERIVTLDNLFKI